MKNLLYIATFATFLFSCNSNEKKNEEWIEEDYAVFHCPKEYQEAYSKFLNSEEIFSIYKVEYEIKEEEKGGEDGMYLIHWQDDEGRPYKMGVSSLSFFEQTADSTEVRTKFDEKYKRQFEQLSHVLSDGKEKPKPRRTWQRILDVGDHAWFDYTEEKGGELEILAGRTKFMIITDLGDNRDLNLKVAIALGQKALEKCH